MARIALLGTELAPLAEESGALERITLHWAEGLRSFGHEVSLVHVEPDPAARERQLASISADLAVVANRPLWGEVLQAPCFHVLHNFPDAWELGESGPARVGASFSTAAGVAAVSRALAREIETRYSPSVPVGEVDAVVEECFFEETWRGRGGPVLFPNRLLEKKGVRLFLELADELTAEGQRCVMFRHIAPWLEPTGEQCVLLALVAQSPSVELLEPPGSRAEMSRWYSKAGVVVCPSIRPEGLGLCALEAQAVGAPLVTSGLGGLVDATFSPNEVVASLDRGAWLDAIRRALEGPIDVGTATAAVRERYGPAARLSLARAVSPAVTAGSAGIA